MLFRQELLLWVMPEAGAAQTRGYGGTYNMLWTETTGDSIGVR